MTKSRPNYQEIKDNQIDREATRLILSVEGGRPYLDCRTAPAEVVNAAWFEVHRRLFKLSKDQFGTFCDAVDAAISVLPDASPVADRANELVQVACRDRNTDWEWRETQAGRDPFRPIA